MLSLSRLLKSFVRSVKMRTNFEEETLNNIF
jgi:hypothetical protein